MDENKEKKVNGVPAEAPSETPPAARPNRDAYAKMFSEDYPDVDFEDKEARYGKMVEDRENYRSLSKAGRKLGEHLDKHRWLGAMFQDLAKDESGELDPFTWMANNGIDVQQAMEDPEYRKKIADGLKMAQQKQVEGEESAAQKDANLEASANALDALSKEMNLSDEQCDRMWKHLFEEVIVPGMNGEVSKDTWTLVLHALNYDSDIASAREEAGMQARNEKIQNKVKSYDEQGVPPSFSQGAGRTTQKPQKKESNMDFIRRYT